MHLINIKNVRTYIKKVMIIKKIILYELLSPSLHSMCSNARFISAELGHSEASFGGRSSHSSSPCSRSVLDVVFRLLARGRSSFPQRRSRGGRRATSGNSANVHANPRSAASNRAFQPTPIPYRRSVSQVSSDDDDDDDTLTPNRGREGRILGDRRSRRRHEQNYAAAAAAQTGDDRPAVERIHQWRWSVWNSRSSSSGRSSRSPRPRRRRYARARSQREGCIQRVYVPQCGRRRRVESSLSGPAVVRLRRRR